MRLGKGELSFRLHFSVDGSGVLKEGSSTGPNSGAVLGAQVEVQKSSL